MKNNFFFLIFLFLSIFQNLSIADELRFEAEVIENFNKEITKAKGNVVVIDQDDNKLFADLLIINHKTNKHELYGKIFFEDNLGNNVSGEKLFLDVNKKEYIFEDNIIFENKQKELLIKSNKIIFNENDNIFLFKDKIDIIKNKIYNITSNNVTYNKNENNLYSHEDTFIKDKYNNSIQSNNFNLMVNENMLTINEVLIFDDQKNKYEFKKIKYDLNLDKIFGLDVSINNNLDNDKNINQHRSKSRALEMSKKNTTLKKSVYTYCKKRDKCPPWLIKADTITHDKEKKIVNYQNAKLEFYGMPILYFPKFFHPDPSVERQSGFLTPLYSSKKKNNYLKLPYFFAISENSDFTFSPRFYDNQSNLYQGEYRKKTKNSSSIIDIGLKNDSFVPNSNNSTDTHFFLNSNILTQTKYFEESEINLIIQNVSDEKYLKTYDVVSDIIDSQSSLNTKLNFEGYNENLNFSFSTEIYEDLTKVNKNDRFEFIFPNFNLVKSINLDTLGSLDFDSSGYNKVYDTNINEKIFINNINYSSYNKINKNGFLTNYEFLIKNFNSDAKNSKNHKNDLNNRIGGLIQFNSKLPLIKKGLTYNQNFTPKFNLKINPSNSNKNAFNKDIFVDYSNIYSLNRLNSNQFLEGGRSITLGSEYKITNKLHPDKNFSFNLATSLRDKANNDLPIKSSLNQKNSNLIGQAKGSINEFFEVDYNFLADNNLGKFNYHSIKSNLTINNFVTSFEFIEENNKIGNDSFLANKSSLKLGDAQNIAFSTRRNKKTDLTEYYNLIYEYKLDCLTAGLEYNKSYYSDGTLEPEESINFTITIMPFGNKVDSPSFN